MQPMMPKSTSDLEAQQRAQLCETNRVAASPFSHLSQALPASVSSISSSRCLGNSPLVTMETILQRDQTAHLGDALSLIPERSPILSALIAQALSYDQSGEEKNLTLITRWAELPAFDDRTNLKYANSMHESAIHFCEQLGRNQVTLSFKHLWSRSLEARKKAAIASGQELDKDFFVAALESVSTPLLERYFYILEKVKSLIIEQFWYDQISAESYEMTGSLELDFQCSYYMAFERAAIPVAPETVFNNINDCLQYLELLDQWPFKGLKQLLNDIIEVIQTDSFTPSVIHECVEKNFLSYCQKNAEYVDYLKQLKVFFTVLLAPHIITSPATPRLLSNIALKCDQFTEEEDLPKACALALSVYHDIVRHAFVVRGTAARAHWMLHTMLLSKGLLLPPAKLHIAPDLEAMTEAHDVFVERALDEIFVSDSGRKIFDGLAVQYNHRLNPEFLHDESDDRYREMIGAHP